MYQWFDCHLPGAVVSQGISRPNAENCSGRPATIFFVKKPKIFEKVKSEHGRQFSEKPDSARVNHNFQKFSDLGHKNHACLINHYNEHDTTSFLSAYNESEVN